MACSSRSTLDWMRLEMSIVSDVAEKRGALPAPTIVMSKSSAFSTTCSTPMAICVAPGAPMMRCGCPSLKMIEGTTELKRALPGAIDPARSGRGSNTPMQPLYMKPRPGVTTPDGMPSEWVMVKQLPSLARRGVGLRGQPRDRHIDELRIADMGVLVDGRALHRLADDAQVLRRIVLQARE